MQRKTENEKAKSDWLESNTIKSRAKKKEISAMEFLSMEAAPALSKKKEESKEKLYELESPVKERAYFEILRYGRKEAQFLRHLKKNTQMS